MRLMALVLCLAVLVSCTRHSAAPTLDAPPAKAATSTAAQSAEIAPLVYIAVAIGGATVAVAAGLAVTGIAPPKLAAGVAAAGGTLAVGALTLQRFLPYIPWLIVAGLVTGTAYLAVSNRKLFKTKKAAHALIADIRANRDLHAVMAKVEDFTKAHKL